MQKISSKFPIYTLQLHQSNQQFENSILRSKKKSSSLERISNQTNLEKSTIPSSSTSQLNDLPGSFNSSLTEISSIAISNRRPSSSNDKLNYYIAKTRAKATCVQTAIPIIPRRSIKSLTIGLPRGRKRKSWIRSIHGNPPPTIAIPPSLLVNIDVGTNREISGIFQPATMLCHRSVKLDSAKLYVDILVSHEIRMKNQNSRLLKRINVAFDRFFVGNSISTQELISLRSIASYQDISKPSLTFIYIKYEKSILQLVNNVSNCAWRANCYQVSSTSE